MYLSRLSETRERSSRDTDGNGRAIFSAKTTGGLAITITIVWGQSVREASEKFRTAGCC